jgi:hypothetical protein
MELTVPQSMQFAIELLAQGQPAAAEGLARQVLALDPNNPDAEFVLGRALGERGMADDAWQSFERTLWLRPVSRWHVVQAVIAHLKARTYLEIGVAQGINLVRVCAPTKIGVDPASPPPIVQWEIQSGATNYFQMTSDEFFRNPPRRLQSDGIDVAFIDGLHTYPQALADSENCLRYLNPGGVILLHDCNPPTETIATPAASWDDAARMKLPEWTGLWTGDVWKAIAHLRSTRKDLRVCVLDCDFGIGVVLRGESDETPLLSLSPETIAGLSYRDLENNRKGILNLRTPQALLSRLRSG